MADIVIKSKRTGDIYEGDVFLKDDSVVLRHSSLMEIYSKMPDDYRPKLKVKLQNLNLNPGTPPAFCVKATLKGEGFKITKLGYLSCQEWQCSNEIVQKQPYDICVNRAFDKAFIEYMQFTVEGVNAFGIYTDEQIPVTDRNILSLEPGCAEEEPVPCEPAVENNNVLGICAQEPEQEVATEAGTQPAVQMKTQPVEQTPETHQEPAAADQKPEPAPVEPQPEQMTQEQVPPVPDMAAPVAIAPVNQQEAQLGYSVYGYPEVPDFGTYQGMPVPPDVYPEAGFIPPIPPVPDVYAPGAPAEVIPKAPEQPVPLTDTGEGYSDQMINSDLVFTSTDAAGWNNFPEEAPVQEDIPWEKKKPTVIRCNHMMDTGITEVWTDEGLLYYNPRNNEWESSDSLNVRDIDTEALYQKASDEVGIPLREFNGFNIL